MGKERTKRSGKRTNKSILKYARIRTGTNFGILKTSIVVALIVLQFALLLLLGYYLYYILNWLIVASLVITVVFCLIVLSSHRTGQVKATWIFFMLACFTFGWVIFLMSNERIMFGRNKKAYQRIYEKSNFQVENTPENLPKSVKNDCNYLATYGKFSVYNDYKAQYFSDGLTLFDDIIDSLKSAKKFIFMEYFIVSDGLLLDKILEILKQKVEEGVDVRIIYDDMGSHGTLKYKTKKRIREMGIKLHAFNKLVPIFNLALNLRDHRKIVVVDGKIAYTGGANLADEYINKKHIHGYWKDCGIKIAGSCVNSFTLAFLRQWEFLTSEEQDYAKFLSTQTQKSTLDSVLVPYVSGPDYNYNIAREVYENMISSANEKIYIMTPYFIPDETLFNILKNKAQSGVDVRIILPDVPDKKTVYMISLDTVQKLAMFGAKIYRRKGSFVHSKIVLTENSCVVGSINMDQRSFYQQFESAVYTNDQTIMQSVEQDFRDTFAKSIQTTKGKTNIFKQILIYVLRLITPLM
ncbi:MAG: cardiolipin synthase [Christensenellales bacterium]